MTEREPSLTETLAAARARLVERGLLTQGATLSVRVPGTGEMLFVEEGSPKGQSPVFVGLAEATQGAAAQHRAIYASRGDVCAIVMGQQPWASRLPNASARMPGIFDEQLRHLGWGVSTLSPGSGRAAICEALADGSNAVVEGDTTYCLGTTLERLVFNTELLEKCAQAYVLARATGLSVRRIPWLVRWIATGRLRRDQRRAAECVKRGQMPEFATGY